MHINDVGNLTGEERLHLAFLLSELDHELIRQKLRDAHPEWSEKRVRIEYFRILFQPEPVPKWLERQFMIDCDQFSPESPVEWPLR